MLLELTSNIHTFRSNKVFDDFKLPLSYSKSQ